MTNYAMQTWAIIIDSFRDVLDRKLFWIMAAISIFIAFALACFGFDEKGVSVFFGMWHFESEEFSLGSDHLTSMLKSQILFFISGLYLGWVGMIAILAATAGMFPNFMEQGAVDIVLAKPISRARLFFAKYLGSLVFVFCQAVLFVGLIFLVMWFRWKIFAPDWLWCIPLFVLLFSYIYCFCVLFSITLRKTMTSFFLTILMWIAIWTPQMAYRDLLDMPAWFSNKEETRTNREEYPTIAAAVTTLYWIVPKTSEIPLIQGELMGVDSGDIFAPSPEHSQPDPDQRIIEEEFQKEVDYQKQMNIAKSIGSSLACEAVILLLAMWRFCRKDF